MIQLRDRCVKQCSPCARPACPWRIVCCCAYALCERTTREEKRGSLPNGAELGSLGSQSRCDEEADVDAQRRLELRCVRGEVGMGVSALSRSHAFRSFESIFSFRRKGTTTEEPWPPAKIQLSYKFVFGAMSCCASNAPSALA